MSAPIHIADIDVFQVGGIIANENDISRHTPAVTGAAFVRALDFFGMRKSRILPGKLIQKDLIGLTGALLNDSLHHLPSFHIDLVISTVSTLTFQSIIGNFVIQVIITVRTKFHLVPLILLGLLIQF